MYIIPDVFIKVINFLTKPDGLGFPILIGSGLAMVLYLMNNSSKASRKADHKINQKKDTYNKTIYPYKPF